MRKVVLFAILLGLIGTLLCPTCEAYETENVFIVVIDGLGNKEAFEDPTHQYIPNIWNNLCPRGAIYRHFYNTGQTATSTGAIATITSGIEQFLPLNYRDGYTLNVIQKEPSVFEYYRKKFGIAKEKTWIVNGGGANTENIGISLRPLYGSSYGPSVAFSDRGASDKKTAMELERVMNTHHPSLVLVEFAEIDRTAWTGNWEAYINAITKLDSIIYRLYEKIESDSHYAGKTTLIITTSYGRHSDSFKGHGDNCYGCRSLMFLAIGPDIQENLVIEDKQKALTSIAPTVAELLDFKIPTAEGKLLSEMLIAPPDPRKRGSIKPAIAVNGNNVHLVWMSDQGRWNILYKRSTDGGHTWSAETLLGNIGVKSNLPAIVADVDKVAVAWSSFTDKIWKIFLKQSSDGGETWGSEIELAKKGNNLNPSLSFNGDYLEVVWSTFTQNIAYRELDGDTVVSSTPVLTGYHIERPTMATQGTTNHVAWKEYSYDDLSNEICYSSGSSGIWSSAAQLTHAAGESRDPSLITSVSKLHLFWADNRDGRFGVYYRNSIDGITWSEEKKLISSDIGAWNPRGVSLGDGAIGFVYEETRAGVGQIRWCISFDGGLSWEDSIPVSETPNHCTNPAVAADDAGNIYISWQEYVGGKWKVNVKKIPFTISGVDYVSSAVWTGVVDVRTIGDYTYCAFWNGVGIMDISDPTKPALVGKVYTQGRGWGIDVVGSYAYLADDWKGLQVVDISNPDAPEVLGCVDTPGVARDVAVQGNYAYVADTENGLQVVDISSATNPILVGQCDTHSKALAVAVSGEYVYIADLHIGLTIFDVSTPEDPRLISIYNSLNGYGIFVRENIAYLSAGENGFMTLDVSNPFEPVNMDSIPLNMALNVDVEGKYAYVIDLNEGFFIIDVSDPYNLRIAGQHDTDDFAYKIDARGDILYVADGWTGCFTIWNASDIDNINIIGQYWTLDETYDVFYKDGKAYVVGGKTGLFIVDVSIPDQPVLMSNYPLPGWENRSGTGVFVHGDYAYVSDGLSGLNIIGVTDPFQPKLLCQYDTQDYAIDIWVEPWGEFGNLAFVAANLKGLQIVDVRDPYSPSLIGTCSIPGEATGVYVNHPYIYIAAGSAGLQVIDASNPEKPILSGCLDTDGYAYGLSFDEKYVYLADGSNGMVVIDASDPTVPTQVAVFNDIPQANLARDLAISGCYCYIAYGGDGGVGIVNICDPTDPTYVSGYRTPGISMGISVDRDYVYIADFASLMILRTDR